VFKIGKLFHLTHVVEDLDAVDAWYDDIFAVEPSTRASRRPPLATPPSSCSATS